MSSDHGDTLTSRDRQPTTDMATAAHSPCMDNADTDTGSLMNRITFDPADIDAPMHGSMSPALWAFARKAQQFMPEELSATPAWAHAVSGVVGRSSPDDEQKRTSLVVEWMWATVLPLVQPHADRQGFGSSWSLMTERRTWRQAEATSNGIEDIDFPTAKLAYAASYVFAVAEPATIEFVVEIADTASQIVDGWAAFDPAALLQKLVDVTAAPVVE